MHSSLPSGLNRSIFAPLSSILCNPCSATNHVGRYPNDIETRDRKPFFTVGAGASQEAKLPTGSDLMDSIIRSFTCNAILANLWVTMARLAETLSIVLRTGLYTPMTLACSECGSAYMQGHSADYLYRQIRTAGRKD